MTKRTIIYLHSIELSQASWVICEDEEVEKSILRGHLSDLSSADKLNEIIVIVPAGDVLLTEASLPKLNRQRLMQALPFALEDSLIDDLNKLHFAVADYQPNGMVPVAIVGQQKMEEWTGLFKQYDITPAQLYSAVFVLPLVEKSWSACVLQETSTVRQNKYQGFNTEQANLPLMIEIALQSSLEKPECIHIYSTFSEPVNIKLDSILINEIHLSEQDWLETLPAWIDPSTSINLLQGIYQPKHKSSETKKIWTFAMYATCIWIFMAFFSELISFFILHHEANKLDSQINYIYTKNFPDAHSMVSPRERLERKLSSLEEQTNKNYFFVLLAKTGSQLLKSENVQLKNLDFRDDQLRLELTANKFEDLDILTQGLTQQDLKVKQQNAVVDGNQVKASLLIQRGNS